MAAILATANRDLWAVLAALGAMSSALAWWNRHDRARDCADGPGLECDATEDFGLQDEGWQH